MSSQFKSKEELISKIKTLIGKSVGEIDVREELQNPKSKGNIGHVIEQGFFGYALNSKQEPDFENLGIDLKVTGYRWVNNGTQVSAKERLVITMVNFLEDYKASFRNSNCYSKMNKMLLVFYEYETNKKYYDFVFSNYHMYEYDLIPEKDKMIIENDWETIINKIKKGEAHNLSEGDTFYLGACPKGANKKSLRKQPFSNEPAMQRAYTLKSTYMTYLLRTEVFHKVDSRESFIKDLNLLKSNSLESLIYQTFDSFIGKSLTEIDSMLFEPVIRQKNKQYIRSYISKMLRVQEENLLRLEEFEKANIQIKSIRVNRKGKIRESMSFPAFDFVELSKETWENSEVRDKFLSTKFLFVVFEEIDDVKQEYRFKGVKLWNMPIDEIDNQLRVVWERTNRILNGDLVLRIRNGIVYNNFPKKTESMISHIRPHSRVRAETIPLPISTNIRIIEDDGSVDLGIYLSEHQFTKQCFWLNSDYVLSKIKGVL